jgi:hypothetical protein
MWMNYCNQVHIAWFGQILSQFTSLMSSHAMACSDPAILEPPSQLFFEGELIAVKENHLPMIALAYLTGHSLFFSQN